MIITCGECNSSFVLDDSLIKTTGSKVRCSNCKHVFVVYPAKEEMESAQEEPVIPQAEAAVPKADAPAAKAAAPLEDDPDLSKALAEINEDELEFSAEELGIEDSEAPVVKESVQAEKPVVEETIPAVDASDMPTDVDSGDAPAGGDEILDFADFELDMDEDDIPGDVEAPDSSVTEELGLSFDESAVMGEQASESGESLDLEGDLDEELDFSDLERELSGEDVTAGEALEPPLEDDSVDTADTVVVDEDGLDFSDLNLDEDGDDQADEDDFKLDLDEDLDLGLEEELDLDVSEELDLGLGEDEAVETETMMIEDELDFSDLERELDGPDADDVPASEDELDLDLDMDDEVAEPETVLLEEDELDFSEFELDEPKEETAEASDQVKEESLESEALDEELDFSGLSDILESDEQPEDLPAGDEDLELELDLDSDDGMDTEAVEVEEDEEELDFSDLENILDGIDEVEETKAAPLPEDIDLELDQEDGMEEEFDLGLEDSESRAEPEEDDLDFSDVEAMLGSEDDDDDDLDLDLGDEEETLAAPADDDLALSLENEEGSDIELELDLTEEDSEEDLEDEEPDMDMLADADAVDDGQEAGLVEKKKDKKDKKDKKAAKKTAKRKAKGKGGLVVKLLLTLIFILLILFVLYMSKSKIEDLTGAVIPVNDVPVLEEVRDSIAGMEIPFVSSWVKPEPKDPQGKLMLKTSGITGKIIVSETLGDLFVISGKVKNNYASTRNSISLVGKLFGEGGKVVQSKLFYAGNVIPEDELVTMDEDVIKKRLQNRLGDNGINAKVRPGQIVPFMVVFTSLTENLTEFSVETGGSFQGAAIK